MNIVAIEDDPLARMVLESSLIKLGYKPRCFGSASEAWSAILAERPQVVVSDWYMDGMNGLDLCSKLRESKGPYVYFILITMATADRKNREEALAAGVDEFLSKPLDLFDLKVRLRGAERIADYVHKVSTLEGFLPMCSYCKKIRDDAQYWQQIENYIAERTGTLFSHSICPECFASQVQPELRAYGINLSYSDEEAAPPSKEGG